MASAKQIAWRKKFAKMSKAGKFKKVKMGTKDRARQWSTGYKGIQSKKTKSSSNPYKKKNTKLKESDYGTSKDPHQIPQGMLDELYQSKIRGFPFFAYTGIREFVMMGNDSLMLKQIPPNPTGITAIQIIYNKGADGFTMVYFVGNNRVANPEILFVGDLANAIVQKMGIS